MTKKKISVIVPVFNSEKYLHECLKSIINQSYKNIRVILIDDGSIDNSGKICEQYAFVDKRIRVIHTKNHGPAAARNIGIKNASTEFIFFMDADDFIKKDALDLLIRKNTQYKTDLIIGDFKKIKNGVGETRNDISFPANKLLTRQDIVDYARFYLKKPNKYLLFAFSWGRLFKSSIIKENNIFFNEKLHTFEDVAFNFDYLKYTKAVFFAKKTIYNHRVYDNYSSATMDLGSNPEKLFGYKQALVNIYNFLKNKMEESEIKKETGHADTSLTIIQLIRVCGQINETNGQIIYQFIDKLINDAYFRQNLQYYSPEKGNSKILPLLIKLKLVWPIIFVCRYKAQQRYGNRKN